MFAKWAIGMVDISHRSDFEYWLTSYWLPVGSFSSLSPEADGSLFFQVNSPSSIATPDIEYYVRIGGVNLFVDGALNDYGLVETIEIVEHDTIANTYENVAVL